MFGQLLTTRRFAPLFLSQFFSAFNDNFVRNMLAMLILFQLGDEMAGSLVTLAVGIFILPSIFLSALGGQIADAHDKALIARRLKFAEIFVQMIAAAGSVFASLPLLYLALFGLGVISALFGPIKYGILPDHLRTEELPAGNALVEGATFLAILLGIVFGGYAASHDRGSWSVVVQLMVIALLCWGTSRLIPPTKIGAPGLTIDRNVFRSSFETLGDLKRDARLWIGGIAVSWFWTTGAVALSLVPVIVKHRTGGGIAVESAISGLFAIGIALGSLTAAMVAHGRILLLPTPVSAIAMGGLPDRPGPDDPRTAASAGDDVARRLLLQRRRDTRQHRRRGAGFRGRHVRRSGFLRRAGLGAGGEARTRHRRRQYSQFAFHRRRSPAHGVAPVGGRRRLRAGSADRSRRAEPRRQCLAVHEPAGELCGGLPDAPVPPVSPARGAWSRTYRGRRRALRHRGQSRVVPRRADDPGDRRSEARFRHRPPDREQMVGEAFPAHRQIDADRSDPAARDAGADPAGEGRQPAGHFPRGAHYRHGIADEGL